MPFDDDCPHFNLNWGTNGWGRCQTCRKITKDSITFYDPWERPEPEASPCNHYRIRAVRMDKDEDPWVVCELCCLYSNDGESWVNELLPSMFDEPKVKQPLRVAPNMHRYEVLTETGVHLQVRLGETEEKVLEQYSSKHPYMHRMLLRAVRIKE